MTLIPYKRLAHPFIMAVVNKHLMTGTKGNSEFCFPETLKVSQGKAKGKIEFEGKQKSLFLTGPVIKCFVIHPNSKLERTRKKSWASRQLGS